MALQSALKEPTPCPSLYPRKVTSGRLLQSGEGKGKSDAVSQRLLRLLIRVLVGHCPVACAWLRITGRIILINGLCNGHHMSLTPSLPAVLPADL